MICCFFHQIQYFYIDSHTCEQINTLCNKINIYDSKGELVYTTINQNGYIVDFKEVPTNLNMTYEVEGYYEAKDGKIKKYNFEHEEIKSDLYDELYREKQRQKKTNETLATFKAIKKFQTSPYSNIISNHDIALALLNLSNKPFAMNSSMDFGGINKNGIQKN